MTVAARPQAVTVSLLDGCSDPACIAMAGGLKAQLDPDYSRGMSVMGLDGWAPRRTARRRAAHAGRLGYWFGQVDRMNYTDDIYEINTSKEERQGRPMAPAYGVRATYPPDDPMVCPHHYVYRYGVIDTVADTLVAYLWLYRSGGLALVSSILGHADALEHDVMYLLFNGMCEQQQKLGGTVFYNRWDSGTDGLRYFKARVGLEQRDVSWTL